MDKSVSETGALGDLGEKIARIRQCYLFTDADERSLTPLAQASFVQKFNRAQSIFSIDDPADGLRIVLSGEVRIWLADQDGHELTLVFLNPGDVFGEIALLDGLPRSAYATASKATECLFLPASVVQAAMTSDTALAKHLIYSLCELLRRNLGTISGFAFSGLEARLAQLLCELAVDHAEVRDNRAVFSRKFSQTDLALLLGVSREAVNKRYKAFEQEGLVALDGSRLVLPDLARLTERHAGAE